MILRILFGQELDTSVDIVRLYQEKDTFFQHIPEGADYASIMKNIEEFQICAASYIKNKLDPLKLFTDITSEEKICAFLINSDKALTIEAMMKTEYEAMMKDYPALISIMHTLKEQIKDLQGQLRQENSKNEFIKNELEKLQSQLRKENSKNEDLQSQLSKNNQFIKKLLLFNKTSCCIALLIGLFIIKKYCNMFFPFFQKIL